MKTMKDKNKLIKLARILIALIVLRMNLMLKHKSFAFVFILITMMTMILVGLLYQQVNRGLKIPIGIVDEDRSLFSKYLVEELRSNELIEVITLESKDIDKSIKSQRVEAVYIIESGTQKHLESFSFDKLLKVVYMDENYFAHLLTDIVSSHYLDEICIRIAQKYYDEAIEAMDLSASLNQEQEVYREGQSLNELDRDGYYLQISTLDEQNIHKLQWYDQSVILEKMTIGIAYIFIAFFALFIGFYILIEEKLCLQDRMRTTKITEVIYQLSVLLSMIIGCFLMSVPLLIISVLSGKNMLHMLALNSLYVITIASFVFLLLRSIKKEGSYIMIGLTLIIIMGIVSGSFFSINLDHPVISSVAKVFPTFYSINVYFDKELLKEYSIYTSIYTTVSFFVGSNIERIIIRRR